VNQLVTPLFDTDSTWQAELNLGLMRSDRGTVLRRCRHRGPLYVQKPFYPEGTDLAHLYLLHPPGGMVSGDDLRIAVKTESGARALITTPGAGRVYRARPDRSLQCQSIVLDVKAGTSIEWLPLENIIYPDACTNLTMDIYLAETSCFIAWDVTCFGLPASDERFDRGQVAQTLQVFQQGRLALREKLTLNPLQNALMDNRAGMGGYAVNGLLVAGPFPEAERISELLSRLIDICGRSDELAAVTLNGEFLQIRSLGSCSTRARQLLTDCWFHIRPILIGRDGCEPRIWAT